MWIGMTHFARVEVHDEQSNHHQLETTKEALDKATSFL